MANKFPKKFETHVEEKRIILKYKAFCEQHRLRMYSLRALALKIRQPLSRVCKHIDTAIECFPESFASLHEPLKKTKPKTLLDQYLSFCEKHRLRPFTTNGLVKAFGKAHDSVYAYVMNLSEQSPQEVIRLHESTEE